MKAVYLNKKAGAEALIVGEMARPSPNAGEVLVKVHATAVMPTELQWGLTFTQKSGQPFILPILLSHEFAGVIEEVGPNVDTVGVGEAVYGLNDWFSNGAQAEYCVAPASAVARKPRSLDDVHAAVAPISALTAWQGLFDRTHLESGERIMVHGAAGGVGTLVVQLAKWRGAHVLATASSGNLDFVRSLGADEVIDYRASRFEDVAREVDVVFDCVGGETLSRSWSLLKQGGRLVTVATQGPEVTDARAHKAFMLVQADGEQLGRMAELIDTGKLRFFVEKVYPLEQARDAFENAGRGRMRGKIALRVAG